MSVEEKFTDWLEEINKVEKIDKSIIAFNFGIFQTEKSYGIYLIGSKIFDKEDDDWATEVDFEPKQKYFIFDEGFSQNRDWDYVLEYSEKLIASYINSEKFNNSIFINAQGITTGFDDGDLVRVK